MTRRVASALAAPGFAAWCALTLRVTHAQSPPQSGARYVGSAQCQSCHKDTYAGWSKTRMANVVLDPKAHPDAIIPDLSKPDPLVTFKKADIAFVYGGKWKQRYFTKVGDDYFRSARNGTPRTKCGGDTSSPTARTGGSRTTLPTTCSGRRAQRATAVIQSITT
jgi:hypothetical protein